MCCVRQLAIAESAHFSCDLLSSSSSASSCCSAAASLVGEKPKRSMRKVCISTSPVTRHRVQHDSQRVRSPGRKPGAAKIEYFNPEAWSPLLCRYLWPRMTQRRAQSRNDCRSLFSQDGSSALSLGAFGRVPERLKQSGALHFHSDTHGYAYLTPHSTDTCMHA